MRDYRVADALWDEMKPHHFREFVGCNRDPENLTKHLLVMDTIITMGILLNRMPSILDVTYLEDSLYEKFGGPKCWEDERKKLRQMYR